MTDDELADFLNIKNESNWRVYVSRISPQRRATFEKMKQVEAWDRGEGPLPNDVLVDLARQDKRKRTRL